VRTEQKLHVSDRAHLTLPVSQAGWDRARKKRRRSNDGAGDRATYEDKYGRVVYRSDLRNLARARSWYGPRVAAAKPDARNAGAGVASGANAEEHAALIERLAPRLLRWR